jgi:DNA polymerase-1
LPSRITDLYLDFETSSGDSRLDALNPWHHCVPAGFGFTWDNEPRAFYVPMHVGGAAELCRRLIEISDTWVNHHVKYDAHVYLNNIGPIKDTLNYRCTVVGAKLINSDMMFAGSYSLDNLSHRWLGHDITPYEEALKPYLNKNKDYGRIPDDVIGEYGGQDVITCRELDRFIYGKMPEMCYSVWATEQKLTRVLLDIEQYGMGVDPQRLKILDFELMFKMLNIEEELHRLLGWACRPHTNADCHEVLHVQYGLPVMGWTKTGEPSYDKYALASYLEHPHAPHDIVSLMLSYRKMHVLRNTFVRPYRELEVDGVLHPSYNQMVRTGRMSCSDPNSQQLSKEAKELIVPRPGNAFLSMDLSQIEFRIIAHYIKDEAVIAAYQQNPDTDFHSWVASECRIKRKPAKTVNFMIGYGGGKRKTIATLAANEDIIKEINDELGDENDIGKFSRACESRGLYIYDTYHKTLPNLKKTSYLAAGVASNRGYVFNLYGRHRKLSRERAHTAFNTICQSSAADLMKERTVAMHEMLKGTPIKMIANVHDEALFEGPEEMIRDPRTVHDLAACFETPNIELRVPIRCSAGISNVNWREAGADGNTHPVNWSISTVRQLDHLKMG